MFLFTIYVLQLFYSVTCGYFGVGFNSFIPKGKNLLVYTNLFSSNNYEKNHNALLK